MGFLSPPDMPDYSSIYSQQMEQSTKAAEDARAQDLEDRIYFRSQAEKDRKLQDEREAKKAARLMKDEKRRIEDLSEAEADAAETAGEIDETGRSDRDSNFGNMFAALLQGFQGGGNNFSPNNFTAGGTGGTTGLRKFNMPTRSNQ